MQIERVYKKTMRNKKFYFIALTISLVTSTIVSCGSGTPYIPYNANTNTNNNTLTNTSSYSNTSSSVQSTNVVTGLGSVLGKVVDSKGKALEGAEVKIQGISSISDANGEYHLDKIPEGRKQITATYGKRIITINVTVQGDTAITPDIDPIQFGNNGSSGSGEANTQLAIFNVDQDLLNQWRSRGIAVLDGSIYVAVSDTKNLFKKGSVIQMNSVSGQKWENVGDSYWGLKYLIDQDVQSVATDGTSVYAIDGKGVFYTINKTTSKITSVRSGPGKDLAIGNGCIYIANGNTVEKSDLSGESRTIVSDLVISGGIATDSKGNLFVISGKIVKKLSQEDGKITDIATEGIDSAIDLAIDDKKGFIYVLDSAEVKRFDMTGKLLASFGNASVKPVSIATDELGNVYVSDEGTSYKDSKIVKFSPASEILPGYENPDIVKNQLEVTDFYSDGTTTDTTNTTSDED